MGRVPGSAEGMRMNESCRLHRTFLLILISTGILLLAGCGSVFQGAWDPYQPNGHILNARLTAQASSHTIQDNKIVVWGNVEPDFLEEMAVHHPDIGITVIAPEPDVWKDRWLTSIASGESADVFVYDAADASWCAGMDFLENLSQPGYRLNELLPQFSAGEWLGARSLDARKMTQLPLYTYPILLFYRPDVLEKAGFLSEPNLLARYLREPENWVRMGRELLAQDKHILEWREYPWSAGNSMKSPFTVQLAWRFNTEDFTQVLEASLQMYEMGAVAGMDIWDEEGLQAIRSGKLVAFTAGAGEIGLLPELAPEMKGLWRVTRMPMGLEGDWGTQWMAINRSSEDKGAAWTFLKEAVLRTRKEMRDKAEEPLAYYGGQRVYGIVETLRNGMKAQFATPMDNGAQALFLKNLDKVYTREVSVSAFLSKTEAEIREAYGADLEMLRDVWAEVEWER